MSRNKARLVAMQSLFQLDDDPKAVPAVAEHRAAEENLTDSDVGYLNGVLSSVAANKDSIDAHIGGFSIDWDLHRLGKVERAILRLAVGEMLYIDDVPTSVAINEAVLLGKKYGADQSAKFINGILGKFSREVLKEEKKSGRPKDIK